MKKEKGTNLKRLYALNSILRQLLYRYFTHGYLRYDNFLVNDANRIRTDIEGVWDPALPLSYGIWFEFEKNRKTHRISRWTTLRF